LLTMDRLFGEAKTVIKSIVGDARLVSYGLLLLAMHALGIVLLYDALPEFDIVAHFWFGFVLSEYSGKAARAVNLQSRLAARIQRRGWASFGFYRADLLLRLVGFLLIGGLFWEWAELTFSRYFRIRPDSFFAFPITLHNIDGTIDVSVGILGAILAFLLTKRRSV